MLKIAICDDDAGDRERVAEDLRVYAAAHQKHSIEMTVYSSAFAMLDAFEKAGCPDIALLDICMPGMLGTELARDILRCSENTDILFLTTSSDYAVDAFALHAADYIQKPYTQEKLNASLDRVIALRQERTWLLLPCEGELHRIALEDVLYIETDGKRRSFSLASGRKLTVGEACEYLSRVGMCARDYVNREVNASLSGGELKRIEIATILARGTKLSLFDEPEAGIDLWSFTNLIAVFEKMYEQINGSILIISHQERILEIADKIVVIAAGRITAEGPREEILPGLMNPSGACGRLEAI